MALNCRLNRNIVLSSQSGGTCNSMSLSIGVGGIKSPLYIYNIGDVSGFKYENDNRSDDTLVVDTIITDSAFYSVDFSSAEYTETQEGRIFTHTLTLTVNNLEPEYEDIVNDASNGKYLVCFKPNGSEDYRMFGWRSGATLKYSVAINGESYGYTLEFSCTSEFPLLTAYADNFDVKDKVYSPIFKPLYSAAYCEQVSGANNGYVVALYTVKVNSAGQALDTNNKLCQWSGLPQDAYKFTGATSDGDYHILGTYNSSASFDGYPVRIYDTSICHAEVSGSITLSGASAITINLNSTNTGETFELVSTDAWTMVTSPSVVTVTPSNGLAGTYNPTVFQTGVGGTDILQFQNRQTAEYCTLTANVYIVTLEDRYTYAYGTSAAVISPSVQGGSGNYTYNISPVGTTAYTDSNNYLHIAFPTSTSEQVFTLTVTHADDSTETKTATLTVLGSDSDAQWEVLSRFCETDF